MPPSEPQRPLARNFHCRFAAGDVAGNRALHEKRAPVLASSNQHVDVSIRFFKRLRQREGLFGSAVRRSPLRALDVHQLREARFRSNA